MTLTKVQVEQKKDLDFLVFQTKKAVLDSLSLKQKKDKLDDATVAAVQARMDDVRLSRSRNLLKIIFYKWIKRMFSHAAPNIQVNAVDVSECAQTGISILYLKARFMCQKKNMNHMTNRYSKQPTSY